MIRRNTYIKGIKIHNTGSKIVQYADNTELTLEDDKVPFEESMNTYIQSNDGKKYLV